MNREAFEILQLGKRLNSLFPPDLSRSIQDIQRLAPIYREWTQISSALYGNRTSEPPRRKWSVECDPNIPDEFKQKYRMYLDADHRQQRTKRFCDLVRSRNPDGLRNEFNRSYDPKRDFYTIEANFIWQYLDLARKHYEDPKLGSVTQPLLWETVCTTHRTYCRWRYGKSWQDREPSHRRRLFIKFGLDNLPGVFSPGRPPVEY